MAAERRLAPGSAKAATPEKMTTRCIRCGADEAVILNRLVRADFDPRSLPKHLRFAFEASADGICIVCGTYQEWNRYDSDQLREYLSVMASKDQATGEEAFHTYPVPDAYVADWDDMYVKQRVLRWQSHLDGRVERVQRALFLRPVFGGTIAWAQEQWNPEIYALEVSDVARRTVIDRCPGVQYLQGQIHGAIDGPFIDDEPFDAIFVFHTLVHCIAPDESVHRLRKLLRSGGFAIFTHEITRKPWNPFHMFHASEWQLRDVLEGAFDHVERIDDCDPEPDPSVRPYTAKGDSPDLVAWAH